MAQEGYPADPRIWQAYQRIESALANNASRLVFVTPSARELYRTRYSTVPAENFVLIENGYDDASFAAAESGLDPARSTRAAPRSCTAASCTRRSVTRGRSSWPSDGCAAPAGPMAETSDPVSRARACRPSENGSPRSPGRRTSSKYSPPVPYHEALQEMLRADGLIVMQGANCNEQIPAKLYEYFRARRPILGLADPRGDTGKAMGDAGVTHIAKLEDTDQVEGAIDSYLGAVRSGAPFVWKLSDMSRRARASALADVLEEARAQPSDTAPSASR